MQDASPIWPGRNSIMASAVLPTRTLSRVEFDVSECFVLDQAADRSKQTTGIGSHAFVELLQAGHGVVVVDNLCNSREEALRRVERIARWLHRSRRGHR